MASFLPKVKGGQRRGTIIAQITPPPLCKVANYLMTCTRKDFKAYYSNRDLVCSWKIYTCVLIIIFMSISVQQGYNNSVNFKVLKIICYV